MKDKKENKKFKNKTIVDRQDEKTLDGVKLSQVFSDDKKQFSDENPVKIEKQKEHDLKNFEIDFDPNLDVELPKKGSFFKKFVAVFMWIVIVAIASVGGYVVGDFVIAKLDGYDPNSISVTDLKDSDEDIARWRMKGVASLSAAQVFVVAEANLNACTYYSMTTMGYNNEEHGIVKNSFKDQDVWGYRYRNGDTGYFNYYSTGIIPVIMQTRYNYSGGNFFTYDGTLNDDGTTTWNDEALERTADEYAEAMGTLAYYPIDYIVTTKTVIAQSSDGVNGDNYSYTISLSPKKSVANYVKKMKTMSGLPDYPSFQTIEMKFTVDKNMNFQSIAIKEEYKVNYGMTVTCTGTLKYVFSYDNIKII